MLVIWGTIITQCTNTEPDPNIIAEVGNRSISVEAFKRAYVPVLLYTSARDNESTRETLLNDLMGQKILAQSAELLHLDTNAKMDHWIEPIRRNAILRKVYEKNVRDELRPPTESDLRIGFKRANENRRVRHLFVHDKTTADSLFKVLKSGKTSFQDLARSVFQDSVLKTNGGELGWIRFGDLDETLEDTIYSLPTGKVSKSTKSAYGWHLVEVEDIQRQKILNESDFQLLAPRIKRIITERREFSRSRTFINNFMQQADLKFNPEVAPTVFKILAERLLALRDNLPAEKLPEISNREIGIIQNDLTPWMEKPFATFSGKIWTVADFATRLPYMNARLMFQNLQTAAAFLIRDEVLLSQAEKDGLGNDPEVLSEVQDRRDQILSQLYLQFRWDSLTVTPAQIHDYFESTWAVQYLAPDSLYLEGFRFTDENLAQRSFDQIKGDNDFNKLNDNPDGGKFVDLGWHVRGASAYPVFYDQLLNVAVLTVKGHVFSDGYWWNVRATQRRRHPLPFAQIRAKVEQDYRAEIWRSFRIKMITANQGQYKTSVNFDLLNHLPVDNSPKE